MADQNNKLAKGILFKEPHVNAPDFIIGKLSIKNDEFINYLNSVKDGDWTNFEVKLSRDGKPYVEIDTWKPTGQGQPTNSASSTSPPRQKNDGFQGDEF